MDTNLVEKTRQKLIELHGENTTEKIGNYTYKKINSYLTAFEKFIVNFNAYVELLEINLDDYKSEMSLICRYCEDCEYVTMEDMSECFAQKIKHFNSTKLSRGKKVMLKFFADVKGLLTSANFHLNQINSCFKTNFNLNIFSSSDYDYLKCKPIRNRYGHNF